MTESPKLWRVGSKVPINVYEGDRPICQCHTVADARRIVKAVNLITRLGKRIYDVTQKARE